MTAIFENKGYQINRENRCCVCGGTEKLTRHHIIPSCYINKLDPKIKEDLKWIHDYYYEWDYCCVCKECHERYEREYSRRLHQKIRERYGVKLEDTNFKKRWSVLPKPSEAVMKHVKNREDYIALRNMCIEFFKSMMEPEFSLL